jgi:hypothetical protein
MITVTLGRIFNVEGPGQRQHSTQRQSIDEAQREQRPVAIRQREAHGQNPEHGCREDDGWPPADAVAEIAEGEAADHGPEQPHAEDVAELNLAQVILGSEIRRRETDEIAVQAIKERDDPGDQH